MYRSHSGLQRSRRFPWLASILILPLGALFFYSLSQLRVARSGLAEDLILIPDGYQTPIRTFSPSSPPYKGAVLLLHGYGGSKEMMQGLAIDLAQEGFYTFCLDFPGSGDSRMRFSRKDNFPALESAYLNLLGRALIMPDKVALIGHSMGGRLALRFGAEHPEVRATIAVSAPLPEVGSKLPRNVLLLFDEKTPIDTARLWAGVPKNPKESGPASGDGPKLSARRARIIPHTNHFTLPYSETTSREIRAWLKNSFRFKPPIREELVPRNFWITLAYASVIMLFVPLSFLAAYFYPIPKEFIEFSPLPLSRLLLSWTASCLLGAFTSALLPARPWIPIQVTDFLSWTYLLGAGLLIFWGIGFGTRIRIRHLPSYRPILLAVAAFFFLYGSFSLIADQGWLHFGLGHGRWPVMFRAALFFAPLIFLHDIIIRSRQQPRGLWKVLSTAWASYAILIVGLMLPAWLGIGNTDGFLLNMSFPLLAFFFLTFSILSAVLYRATGSVLCSATWNILSYAWIFTAPYFWK